MLMLLLPKSLGVFLVYLMHNHQALTDIPIEVKCGQHLGFLVLEKVGFFFYSSGLISEEVP